MTEAEWLSCSDPQRMLTLLRRTPAGLDRKFRLFACACCRRVWARFPDQSNRDLVVAVEDYPTHTFDDPEIRRPAIASSACESECRENPAYWVAKTLGRGFYKMTAAMSAALVSAQVLSLAEREVEEALLMVEHGFDAPAGEVRLQPGLPSEVEAEAAAQAALVRDVFGNPFRPAPFDAAWRTDTVVSLARQAYEAREFGAMPILADALQDAGCDNEDVLNHCRDATQVHVRGCWVVDEVLGNK